MKMKSNPSINLILLTLFVAILLLAGAGQVIGIKLPAISHAASEDSHYGILGQPAPELDLTDWIDGEGQPMDPIRLSGLKGKVIYLYFFQDW